MSLPRDAVHDPQCDFEYPEVRTADLGRLSVPVTVACKFRIFDQDASRPIGLLNHARLVATDEAGEHVQAVTFSTSYLLPMSACLQHLTQPVERRALDGLAPIRAREGMVRLFQLHLTHHL